MYVVVFPLVVGTRAPGGGVCVGGGGGGEGGGPGSHCSHVYLSRLRYRERKRNNRRTHSGCTTLLQFPHRLILIYFYVRAHFSCGSMYLLFDRPFYLKSL